ncbi:hypothetical protein PAK_P100132c [Pseudomonas phage PAK_P1]|uniref:Uncharacterized protein n=1 Tax=Pseudomonas phage PAK_P1 TaxID=743813 RepID=V5K3E3_9CAUD|nr:hypothetical protein PAK_P100132c [Pseudomonas phage PAK_P1]AGS81792.1 hypothetical protein PAK_P100132c [Pseudomonas phage PAK_P1]
MNSNPNNELCSDNWWYPARIGCIKSLQSVAWEAWSRDFWDAENLNKILRHNGFSPAQSKERALQYMDQINREYCSLMMDWGTREDLERLLLD